MSTPTTATNVAVKNPKLTAAIRASSEYMTTGESLLARFAMPSPTTSTSNEAA